MAVGEHISGTCLCCAVTYVAELEDGAMHVCHCGMCRRWTGGVFMYLPVVPHSLKLAGAGLGVYASSDIGERGFCTTCGSSLFWRRRDGSSADVNAQSVEDPGRFPFRSEIFYDDKPAHYEFANPTTKVSSPRSAALDHEEGAGNG